MRIYYLPVFLLLIYHFSWSQTYVYSADNGAQKAGSNPAVELFQPAPFANPLAQLPAMTPHYLLTPSLERIRQLYDAAPTRFHLVIPQGKEETIRLELERVDILSDAFFVELHIEGRQKTPITGIHYRGRIVGRENSVAAISLFPDEVVGLWNADDMPGNWVLGRVNNAPAAAPYLLYEDTGLVFSSDFSCTMPDTGVPYSKEELTRPPLAKDLPASCLDLFLEVDYDVFKDKGGADNTIKFVTSLFNQVAAVFAADDISVQLSQLYIWNASSPYMGATVDGQLAQFQEYRTEWQGNLAQLISYKVNGGVAAGFDGPCAPDPAQRMSYAGIQSNFSSIPNYSWSVNVTAHELGHLLGVRHTHACVWYGTGRSIDDCGNTVMAERNQEPEGQACYDASNPRYPTDGGTLMSYCHLVEGIGISLNKGFHEQPAAVIQRNLAKANCLAECTPQVASNVCVGNVITLSLTLDDYGSETTWRIKDEDGLVLYEGGPYADGRRGQSIERELCLGIGCFTFELLDAFGDGICCFYGDGQYTLTDTSGLVIAQGGSFNDLETAEFCLPIGGEAPVLRDDCQIIQFNDLPVSTYAGRQDEGEYEILDEGNTIRLWGNAWKSVPLDYYIGPYTLLEFDFGSTMPAEIHGIGLDNDDKTSFNRTFKLFGSQNWGVLQYFNYDTPGEWMSFVIPVGMHFTGQVKNLFFCVDDDIAPKNGDSWFRNIRLYESGDCFVDLARPGGVGLLGGEKPLSMQVFPNPARDELEVAFSAPGSEPVSIQLFNTMGQLLRQRRTLSLPNGLVRIGVSDLPRGTYLLKLETQGEILVDKVVLTR